ncbi:MAG: EAL domain-containing protein [Cyanobacterium sp. T60_A2020_053]|nr:EAL domain-containing protein [Cyanobacterium sp. T60_A2020_053]
MPITYSVIVHCQFSIILTTPLFHQRLFMESLPHSTRELTENLTQSLSWLDNLSCIFYRCRNTPQWHMEYISRGCEIITGYTVQEFIDDEPIFFNNLIHPDDRLQVWQEVQKAVDLRSSYNVEYRIIHRNGEVRWMSEQGEAIYDHNGEISYLEGIVIDISDKKKIEQEKTLLLNLSQAISSAPDFESALLYTIEQVCQLTGWDFGEAWLPNLWGDCLNYSIGWFPPHKNKLSPHHVSLQEFQEKSHAVSFKKGSSLPGRVWQSKQIEWMNDIDKNPLFSRRQMAENCRLKSAFAVPIVANDEIVAILVFFLRQRIIVDANLFSLVEIVAHQLGNIFRHKQIELDLQESQRQLNSLIKSTSGVFFRISYNRQWREDYISDTCDKLTGYQPYELIKNDNINLAQITHPLDLQRVITTIQYAINHQKPYTIEYRIFTKDNQEKWIWEKGEGVYDEDNNVLGIEGFITDISSLKYMERALLEAENKYGSIFDNAIEGIFQTTTNGYYLNANQALAKMYGYDNPTQLKASLNDIENCLYVNPQRRQEFMEALEKNDVITNFESQVYRRDGKVIWISENARAIRDINGNLLYYEGTVEEITKYKEAQEKLQRQAFYDYLTNLPNRSFFLQKLTDCLYKIKKYERGKYEFGLLFLDCDRFKMVNDSLGHHIGDLLLVEVAKRLRKALGNTHVVARLGGDEFTILCYQVNNIKQLIKIAEKINDVFKPPFLIEKHRLFCGISIGIFFSSNLSDQDLKSVTPAQIIQYADTALYRAKSSRNSYYQIFRAEMHNEALAELQLENDLRQAIVLEEFVPFHQPIINLFDQKVHGFETLIRWQHPIKGIISPASFIPLAEQTGLIIPIGLWMFKQACLQWVKWLNKFPDQLFFISVNLSSQEFNADNFLEQIDLIIKETKVNPAYIKLEITESSPILHDSSALQRLRALIDRNLKLWIDDFGTGYSSLSYLHKLPIHGLKLDQSFTSDIEHNFIKARIVEAIFSLAQDLNLEVVAEGIETESQLEKLQELGCQLGQGYLFAKPMNVKDIERFLN